MISSEIRSEIALLLKSRTNDAGRKSLSLRYPFLIPYILFLKININRIKNLFTLGFPLKKVLYLENVIARHSSPLMRKLGDSDPSLQIGKIQNLKTAIKKLDGVIIEPGKIFSLWNQVGSVKENKGYTDGMLISGGIVKAGLGGGMCQLSNFLHWIFLHTDVEILERHHHSMDVFPDSGRTIPFGTGATIFYNLLDLKIKNTNPYPIQIKLYLTDTQLKGQLLSNVSEKEKIHITEKNHCFVKYLGKYYRYNQIYKETYIEEKLIKEKKVLTNLSPVLYEVTPEYISRNNFELIEI